MSGYSSPPFEEEGRREDSASSPEVSLNIFRAASIGNQKEVKRNLEMGESPNARVRPFRHTWEFLC